MNTIFNMRSTLILFILILHTGCYNPPNTFVLEDTGPDKYYLSDSIKKIYKKGYVGKSPLIAINGYEFKYPLNLDTIHLPLKKNEIGVIEFLNNGSSQFIYGENAYDGAIIINTHKIISDTTKEEINN